MLALLVPVLVGLAAALLRGGSFGGWSRQQIRWSWLALLALAIQIPAYAAPIGRWLPPDVVGPVCTTLTTGLIAAMLLRNAVGPTRTACAVAALGVGLNLAVMLANGGLMPRADEIAPRSLAHASTLTPSNTAASGPNTRLAWLSDTIAEPDWFPFSNLVSVGDLLLSLGAAFWAYTVTRPHPVVEETRGTRRLAGRILN